MQRSTLASCLLAVAVALAGCGGLDSGRELTDTETPSDAPTSQPNTGPAHETLVFDTGSTGYPVIEGGLAPAVEEIRNDSYYATLLRNANETERFNRSLLSDDAETFVDETDFETASLLVVQAYPKSSVPDYRVESVTRADDRLDVRINDSSHTGTDDITLETVLVRVGHDGDAPRSAAIETQDGDTIVADDRRQQTTE
ncbi:MAG: hypothetical protein ACOCPX_01545 [Halapricum sp.]